MAVMVIRNSFLLLLLLPGFRVSGVSADENGLGIFITAENPGYRANAFCSVVLENHDYNLSRPLVIQKGDVLEYDLLLSPNSPVSGAGIELRLDGGRIEFGKTTGDGDARPCVGKWGHRSIPLAADDGRGITAWAFRFEGEKAGRYHAMLKNIHITREGQPGYSFFLNQTSIRFQTDRVNGFHSATVSIFKTDFLRDGPDLEGRMERLRQTAVGIQRVKAIESSILLLKDEYERTGKPADYPGLMEKAIPYSDKKPLGEMRPDLFNANFEKVMQILEPLRPFAKQNTLHAASYAHLDFCWQWSWRETLQTANQDFLQVLKFMGEFPDFTFSYSNPALFSALKDASPSLFSEIQKRVKEGRWEMAGSRWCEADMNVISEESHARHFLEANRFNREMFGTQTTVCFEPDIFGHLWTLPQMLRKSGIKYFLSRQMGDTLPLFRWEGLDGSKILCCHLHYYGDELDENILDFSLTKPQRDLGYTDALIVYGVGNHGGGPSYDQIKNAENLEKLPVYPRVKFSTLQRFMDDVAQKPFGKNAPLVNRELPFLFRGSYTTHAETKRLNRACENLLTSAESFGAIAQSMGLAPPMKLDSTWKSLLWNHHHDTIGGTTIHSSDLYAQETLRKIEKEAGEDLQDALSRISGAIRTDGNSQYPRVIFNPVAWSVTQPVFLNLPDDQASWEWVDPEGNVSPIQKSPGPAHGTMGVAVLNSLPGLGYRVGWLRPSQGIPPAPLKRTGPFSARNQFFSIEVSPTTGNLARLSVPDAGHALKEWIPAKREGARFRMDEESPHPFSAWAIGPIEKTEWLDHPDRVECVEEGPVRIVFRAAYRFQKSSLEKDIILYRDLSRLDFEIRINWQEQGTPNSPGPMLRMEFPCPTGPARAIYLVPFGEMEHPQDSQDYPASYGMGLAGPKGSVCLLNNSKTGYSCSDNTLCITLLRSPYFPDPTPDVGRHRIPLALEISSEAWEKAGMARKGLEFNRHSIAWDATPHPGKFPSEQTFLNIEPSTVLLTALKASYDQPGHLIARGYQSGGFPTTARVKTTLPLSKWRETDFIERPLEGELPSNPDSLSFKKWEIKTWELLSSGSGKNSN